MVPDQTSSDAFHSVLGPLSLNTALSRSQSFTRSSAQHRRIASGSGGIRRTSSSSISASIPCRTPNLTRIRSEPDNEWLAAAQSSPYAKRFHHSSVIATVSSSPASLGKCRTWTSVRSTPVPHDETSRAGACDYLAGPTRTPDRPSAATRRREPIFSLAQHEGMEDCTDAILLFSSPCERKQATAQSSDVSPRVSMSARGGEVKRDPAQVSSSSSLPSHPRLAQREEEGHLVLFPSSPPSSRADFHFEAENHICTEFSPITSDFEPPDTQLEDEGTRMQQANRFVSTKRAASQESQQSPSAHKRKRLGLEQIERVFKSGTHIEAEGKQTRLIPEVVIEPYEPHSTSEDDQAISRSEPHNKAQQHTIDCNISVYTINDSEDEYSEDTTDGIDDLSDSLDVERLIKEEEDEEESLTAFDSSPLHCVSTTSTRANRHPLQKMRDLLDAIFEAENEFADVGDRTGEISEQSQKYFGYQNGAALLRGKEVRTLVRTIHACTSDSYASREAPADGPQRWSEIDVEDLHRLVKILHRGMEQDACVDPFPLANKGYKRTATSASPRRRTAGGADEDEAALEEDALDEICTKLRRVSYSLNLTEGCLSVLAKDGSSSSLLCEEMLLPCIYATKNALENVIVPLSEACSSVSNSNNELLRGFVDALAKESTDTTDSMIARCSQQLVKIFRLLAACLIQVDKVLNERELILSDSMAFNLSTSLLPLFFVLDVDSSSADRSKATAIASMGAGQTPLKTLRLLAIHVIRKVYERSEDQRDYIITTILDGMQSLQDASKRARRQFGLTNGKVICSSTALLLQIIQASSDPIAAAKKDLSGLLVEEANEDEIENKARLAGVVHNDVYDVHRLQEGQDLAVRAAEGVARCLMHKMNTAVGSTGKATKGAHSSNASFSSVVEMLVGDLLETLCCPEWPASSLMLSQLCRQMCSCLDDEKGSQDLRGVALDQLGLMVKHWHESESRVKNNTKEAVLRTKTILENLSLLHVDRLNALYWQVINHLRQSSSNGGSTASAARFMEAQWGTEMLALLIKSVDVLEEMPEEGDEADASTVTSFIRHMDTLIGSMVGAAAEASEAEPVKVSAEESPFAGDAGFADIFAHVMHSFSFAQHFEMIEMHLVLASNGPSAPNRNRALRGLNYLCGVDAGQAVQRQESILAAVRRCLFDESVQVRDAAVSLLGKIALENMSKLPSLLPSFKDKMEDAGLLVRKRTLRLFKDFYDKSEEDDLRVECAVEIIRCVFDEEETVRDLAVDIMAQVWFDAATETSEYRSPIKSSTAQTGRGTVKKVDKEDEERSEAEWDERERCKAQQRLKILVQTADRLRVQPNPVQEILRLMSKRRDADEVRGQMQMMVHLTVDDIVNSNQDEADQPIHELLKQVELIALIVQTNPATLSIRKAKALLPYLRGGSSEDEMRLMGRLLNIFHSCLPIMPSTAISLAKQLQAILTPLFSRPSMYSAVLEELTKCFCIVVRHHTKDVGILVKCLQVCHRQMQQIPAKIRSGEMAAPLAKVLLITTSLLVESADFDTLRLEHPKVSKDIDSVASDSISEHVAGLLLEMLEETSLRGSALQALRIICRSFPDLLMKDTISNKVETILREGIIMERSLVLRMIFDAMAIESIKLNPEDHQQQLSRQEQTRRGNAKKAVSREELAGEAESMTSPVTFDIVARYGEMIQSLARHVALQRQVLNIVDAIVMRGICHPLQYLSTIVSLQTVMDDRWVREKAQTLHRHLLSKNNTSINYRHNIHARDAWLFQTSRSSTELRGSLTNDLQEIESSYETWYSTIRETRKSKTEYLKSLVKAFDVEVTLGECKEEHVHFARFVADNLATLKYRSIDEVVLVLTELQGRLLLSGSQVQFSVQEEVPVDGEEDDEEGEDEEEHGRAIVIGRMSTIMSIALRLRDHLKLLYGLSDNQIVRLAEKKSLNTPAVRKRPVGMLELADLPGATERKESVALARQEMTFFDNLLESEGAGMDEDDYDRDD